MVVVVVVLLRRRVLQRQAQMSVELPTGLDESDLENLVSMIDVQQLTFEEELGSGAYGTVYKGKYNKTLVAIKIATGVGTAHILEFLQEVEVMAYVFVVLFQL